MIYHLARFRMCSSHAPLSTLLSVPISLLSLLVFVHLYPLDLISLKLREGRMCLSRLPPTIIYVMYSHHCAGNLICTDYHTTSGAQVVLPLIWVKTRLAYRTPCNPLLQVLYMPAVQKRMTS